MADQEPEPSHAPDNTAPAQGQKRRKGAKQRRGKTYTRAEVLLRFQSCGRCGLFLSGYRLRHEPQFNAAIGEIEGDWLPLPWDTDMRELVNKSYGCRTDIETYYLEGTCPECKRPFAYAEPHPEQTAWFVVKM